MKTGLIDYAVVTTMLKPVDWTSVRLTDLYCHFKTPQRHYL